MLNLSKLDGEASMIAKTLPYANPSKGNIAVTFEVVLFFWNPFIKVLIVNAIDLVIWLKL